MCGLRIKVVSVLKVVNILTVNYINERKKEKEKKGEWWIPRLSEAKKDVISCDKLRVGANNP